MLEQTVLTSSHPNKSGTGIPAALWDIVQGDDVACEILRFLLKNENAMDSLKGIAAWWVRRDELAVQPSLQQLSASGAIVAHALSSGTTVYGLTPDPQMRECLRQAVVTGNGGSSITSYPGTVS